MNAGVGRGSTAKPAQQRLRSCQRCPPAWGTPGPPEPSHLNEELDLGFLGHAGWWLLAEWWRCREHPRAVPAASPHSSPGCTCSHPCLAPRHPGPPCHGAQPQSRMGGSCLCPQPAPPSTPEMPSAGCSPVWGPAPFANCRLLPMHVHCYTPPPTPALARSSTQPGAPVHQHPHTLVGSSYFSFI